MSDIRLVQKTPVSDVGFPLSLILVGFNIQRHIDVSLQSSYSYPIPIFFLEEHLYYKNVNYYVQKYKK